MRPLRMTTAKASSPSDACSVNFEILAANSGTVSLVSKTPGVSKQRNHRGTFAHCLLHTPTSWPHLWLTRNHHQPGTSLKPIANWLLNAVDLLPCPVLPTSAKTKGCIWAGPSLDMPICSYLILLGSEKASWGVRLRPWQARSRLFIAELNGEHLFLVAWHCGFWLPSHNTTDSFEVQHPWMRNKNGMQIPTTIRLATRPSIQLYGVSEALQSRCFRQRQDWSVHSVFHLPVI